jgi:hypothetical protein
MIVPANVLKMAKASKNNLHELDGLDGLAVRRKGDHLEAFVVCKGHYVIQAEWMEMPSEDYPLIQVDPPNSSEKCKDGVLFVIPSAICEQALRSISNKSSFPIIRSLFVEEMERDGALRCFTTNLDSHGSWTAKQDQVDQAKMMVDWVADKDKAFKSTISRVAIDPVYISEVCGVMREVCGLNGKNRTAAIMELNNYKLHPIRLTMNNGDMKVTAYVMPMGAEE